jgi:hypothetical protein
MCYHARAMPFFVWLQHTGLAMWIVQSDSIWAYPSILTAHTVGLALLVGAASIIDLRLLGVAPAIPVAHFDSLFRFVWAGFYVNLVSGLLLFASEAADKAAQPMFILKLALIVAALVATIRLRREAFAAGGPVEPSPHARRYAMTSLALWAAAITAGRLMAYVK